MAYHLFTNKSNWKKIYYSVLKDDPPPTLVAAESAPIEKNAVFIYFGVEVNSHRNG